jgi:hypothetical protein
MAMPPPERIGEAANEPTQRRLFGPRAWLLAGIAALALGSQGPGAPSGPALLPHLLPTPPSSGASGKVVPSAPSPAISRTATPAAATPAVQRSSSDVTLELDASTPSRL